MPRHWRLIRIRPIEELSSECLDEQLLQAKEVRNWPRSVNDLLAGSHSMSSVASSSRCQNSRSEFGRPRLPSRSRCIPADSPEATGPRAGP